MTELRPSAIRAVEYDSSSHQLLIWFPSSGPYTFYGVPLDTYRGLLSAHSAGTYYNRYIRDQYRR